MPTLVPTLTWGSSKGIIGACVTEQGLEHPEETSPSHCPHLTSVVWRPCSRVGEDGGLWHTGCPQSPLSGCALHRLDLGNPKSCAWPHPDLQNEEANASHHQTKSRCLGYACRSAIQSPKMPPVPKPHHSREQSSMSQ